MPEANREISPPQTIVKKPNYYRALNSDAASRIQNELNNINQEGFGDNYKIPVIDAAQKLHDRLTGLEEKVSKFAADAQEAKKVAQTDSLTGLYNRRFLDNYVENFDSNRSTKPAVIFCDADNLGAINKRKGDSFGDRLIINISKILQESVRDGDLVIRKGGDEFVIIIEKFSNFEELNNKLSQRFKSKQVLGPKFSFGIVQYDQFLDRSLVDTIQRANDKMREDYPDKKIVKF